MAALSPCIAWPREEALRQFRKVIPALTASVSKGHAGRIAVIGGCEEYTGAPTFAAFTALRCGADLSHVFCSDGASVPIKSFSPDLIVHPYLRETGLDPMIGDADWPSFEGEIGERVKKAKDRTLKWLRNIDALVIGPGLGRDPGMLKVAMDVAVEARKQKKALVFDGDGTQIPLRNPSVIQGYKRAIITPNGREFDRLFQAFQPTLEGVDTFKLSSRGEWSESEEGEMVEQGRTESTRQVVALAKFFDGVTILKKGGIDVISDGTAVLLNSREGSLRRCGGQGDILSGSVGTFSSWAVNIEESGVEIDINPFVLAAFAGSCFLRRASLFAYRKKKRAMLTHDVLDLTADAFHSLFEEPLLRG